MYWKDQETALKTSKTYMERARLIRETLEPLKNEFEQLKYIIKIYFVITLVIFGIDLRTYLRF